MGEAFRKPFAAPPTIFGVALIFSAVLGFIIQINLLPLSVQLVFGPAFIVGGVLLIRSSIREIAAGATTYDPFDISTSLVTSGIYQYSRNPGYLGLGVIQFGFAVLLDSVWIAGAALAAAMVTAIFVIRLEEEKLSHSFGQVYLDYKIQVRRWF